MDNSEVWRSRQQQLKSLVNTRNQCAHPKTTPTRQDIEEVWEIVIGHE